MTLPDERAPLTAVDTEHPAAAPPRKRRRRFFASGIIFIIVVAASLTLVAVRSSWQPEAQDASKSRVSVPKFSQVPRVTLTYTKETQDARMLANFDLDQTPQRGSTATLDPNNRYEGDASLVLRSSDGRAAVYTVDRSFDLSPYQVFDVMVNSAEPSAIRSLTVRLRARNRSQFFDYEVEVPTTAGWVPVRMPRARFAPSRAANANSWAQIEALEFRLVSRRGRDATVNVDLLRAEGKPGGYTKQWSVFDERMLGFVESPAGPGMLFRNVGGSVASLVEVADAKNFTLTAKLTPIASGRGGLALRADPQTGRGYSFVIGGVGSRSWQLMRLEPSAVTVLDEGEIENIVFRPDEPYWLRATLRGQRIQLSISRDGMTFVPVGTAMDSAFAFGGAGVAVYDSASYVIMSVAYTRLP